MSYRAGSAISTVPAVNGGGTSKAARHGAVCALSVRCRSRQNFWKRENATVVKLRVRAGESIQEAVRRFRKLCERSGLRKEMRRKAYYEKPSERRRREELKRLRKARQHQTSRV
ncbi:MAG: 30S ribosomal protein S21 [Planctomycetaceae bacterium]|nr:30S ribosomal protein S21 [Planctomycetaceae bacterium]MBV8312800.1 30S ribosomal protein S21 [Planctomycetaceae bacterium]